MSLIKFAGTGVTAISGKQGGTVFAASGSAGPFARNWVMPIRKRTNSQATTRGVFSAFMNNFSNLTPLQIANWNTAAASELPYSLRTNAFGDVRNMTGQQLYQRINHSLSTIGLYPYSNVPASTTSPTLTISSINVSPPGPLFQVFLVDPTNGAVTVLPGNTYMVVFATQQMPVGRSVFTSNMFRAIQVFNPGDANPFDIQAAYQAIFGGLVINHSVAVSISLVLSDASTIAPGSVYSRFRPVSKFIAY